MNKIFEQRLSALSNAGISVAGGSKGVEKEALRVTASGDLSQEPHPVALGSALTNPYITTDFSEALLEFVTPAYANTWETLRTVCDIHQFTYDNLDDELLWPASMPCRVPADTDVPLARYGDSNVGTMKTAYRRGLGYRYGRHMQTIAGVHFNYSLPLSFWPSYQQILGDDRDEGTFRSDHYMGMVRNFRRFGWLMLYLFGTSPALCKSFGGDGELQMPSLNDETWYEPFGTSLRMSDLGYNNQNQARLNIGLDGVDDYIRDLSTAIRTPEPAYEEIGVKVDGVYRQLNASLLQIENEYYSSIRPKRVARSGERPTSALKRGGVEYVEVRSLDINVFDPSGINQNTMRFIESFLIYCLLEASPLLDSASLEEASNNQLQTAKYGRDPSLLLYRDAEAITLADWARQILAKVAAVAERVDQADGGESYAAAAASMQELVADPDKTPSARVLTELRSADCSFFEFALSVAYGHRDYFRSIEPLAVERKRIFERTAADSIEEQRRIETSDEISFEEYLARYFADD